MTFVGCSSFVSRKYSYRGGLALRGREEVVEREGDDSSSSILERAAAAEEEEVFFLEEAAVMVFRGREGLGMPRGRDVSI
jgi:hypothetical protein